MRLKKCNWFFKIFSVNRKRIFCKCWTSKRNGVTPLVWRWEQIEVGHFNVVMETRWDCVTSRHLSHLAAPHPICWDSTNCLFFVNWPSCPNFFSLSRSLILFYFCSFFRFFLPNSIPSHQSPLSLSLTPCVSLDPDTVSDDVTLSSKLTVWGESYYFAPVVWVKSPLTEIREHCLLGPALLQLPHRHTWRALLHSSARHTFQNVLYGRSHLLRAACGSVGVLDWCWWYWTRDLKDQTQLW